MSVGLVVKPWIHGSARSASTRARSAPSAKILTRSALEQVTGSPAARIQAAASARFRTVASGRPGTGSLYPRVQEDSPTTGSPAGLDVAPAITDHEARREVEPVLGGVEQHPRLRLAAGALVGVVVRADDDLVEREELVQARVDPIDRLAGLRPTGDLRLVRDDDEREARSRSAAHASSAPLRARARASSRGSRAGGRRRRAP